MGEGNGDGVGLGCGVTVFVAVGYAVWVTAKVGIGRMLGLVNGETIGSGTVHPTKNRTVIPDR